MNTKIENYLKEELGKIYNISIDRIKVDIFVWARSLDLIIYAVKTIDIKCIAYIDDIKIIEATLYYNDKYTVDYMDINNFDNLTFRKIFILIAITIKVMKKDKINKVDKLIFNSLKELQGYDNIKITEE